MTAHTLRKVLSFCLVAMNLKELKNTLEGVCLLSEPTLRPGRPKYRERPIPDDTSWASEQFCDYKINSEPGKLKGETCCKCWIIHEMQLKISCEVFLFIILGRLSHKHHQHHQIHHLSHSLSFHLSKVFIYWEIHTWNCAKWFCKCFSLSFHNSLYSVLYYFSHWETEV